MIVSVKIKTNSVCRAKLNSSILGAAGKQRSSAAPDVERS